MPTAVAMNWSVHTGAKSQKGPQATFHFPRAFISSIAGVFSFTLSKRFTRSTAAASNSPSLDSSRRMVPARMQDSMDMRDAIFSTSRISSRVAPAWSAARIWRRRPSASRLVQAEFKATPTSSTNFSCRTPPVQGLVVILRQVSAHFGSHFSNVAKASPQGPSSFDSSDVSVVVLSALLLMETSLVGCGLDRSPISSLHLRYFGNCQFLQVAGSKREWQTMSTESLVIQRPLSIRNSELGARGGGTRRNYCRGRTIESATLSTWFRSFNTFNTFRSVRVWRTPPVVRSVSDRRRYPGWTSAHLAVPVCRVS